MGTARGLPRSRILAAAADHCGQRLSDPVSPWPPAKSRPFDPARNGTCSWPPRTRNHRRRNDQRLLPRNIDPQSAQVARREDRNGRLRNWIFFLVVPAGFWLRQDQDRSQLYFRLGNQPPLLSLIHISEP